MFDVVVEQQRDLDRRTWLQPHPMALLCRMFVRQSLDLVVQVDMLALNVLDLDNNYLALNT